MEAIKAYVPVAALRGYVQVDRANALRLAFILATGTAAEQHPPTLPATVDSFEAIIGVLDANEKEDEDAYFWRPHVSIDDDGVFKWRPWGNNNCVRVIALHPDGTITWVTGSGESRFIGHVLCVAAGLDALRGQVRMVEDDPLPYHCA